MFRYFLFNKPYGTLSQFTREHPSHKVLSDHFDFPKDVYPVGRLDRDSEGLLLLTNDKKVNTALLHPDHKMAKEYWVQVEGAPGDKDLEPLRKGIEIKVGKTMYRCKPAQVELFEEPEIWDRNPPVRFRKEIPTNWCRIVITEGKNRQVRKMFAKIGFPVLRLVRWRIGKMDLAGLGNGDVREIGLKDLELKI